MARRTRIFALAPPGIGQPAPVDEPMVMDSCISAVVPAERTPGLPLEWQAVIEMCVEPRAVAEVAARLHLPVSTTLSLARELHHRSLLHHQPPMSESQAHDAPFLRRIIAGLKAI